MSTVFNTGGGVVSLPATPTNTLNFAIRGSLGQKQITRNIGNFYTSWDATAGAILQQFSISANTSLALPTGTDGLLVVSNGGPLTLNLSKTTGSLEAPVVAQYQVFLTQLYLTDDSLSAVSIQNVGTDPVLGFIAYVPFTFNG